MYRYEMVVYWSEPDNSFLVEVPELPGCMADGPDYIAAVSNAQTVIEEWIETAREDGRSVPEASGGRLSFV